MKMFQFFTLKNYLNKRSFICLVLVLGLVFSQAPLVFAATQVDQESLYPLLKNNSYTGYLYNYNSGSVTISRGTGLGDILAQMCTTLSTSLKYIYSSVDGLEGYVDGLETGLTNINNKIKDYSTVLSNISGYVDGLETSLSTTNSRLNSILTAVQSITTYNYTSTLNSILANTNYLGSIESHLDVVNSTLGTSNNNGIWGSAYSSALSLGLIQPDIDSIKTLISNNNSLSSFNHVYMGFSQTSSVFNRNPSLISPVNINNNLMPYINWRSARPVSSYQIASRNISSFADRLNIINHNLVQLFSSVLTPYSSYGLYSLDFSDGVYNSSSDLYLYSLMDSLQVFNRNLADGFSKIGFVIADPDTISRKNDLKERSDSIFDDFVSSDGDNSISLSDISSVSSGLGELKSSVSGGANASSAFAVLGGDSDGWNWFSQTVADDMDQVSSGASGGGSRLRSRSGSDSFSTPLLDEYYSRIYSFLGVDYD